MKKAKFDSYSYYHNFIEETEDGELIEIPVKKVYNGKIEGEIVGETKTRYKILIDGNKIISKRKNKVELNNV